MNKQLKLSHKCADMDIDREPPVLKFSIIQALVCITLAQIVNQSRLNEYTNFETQNLNGVDSIYTKGLRKLQAIQ